MNRLFLVTMLVCILFASSITTGEAKLRYSPLWMMDSNQDHMISKDEFIAYAGKVFSEHDKNGKNLMTNAEVEAMMQKEAAAMKEELLEEKR